MENQNQNQDKHYYIVGGRLTREERAAIKEMGLHIYATRSWDEGCGCQLEHRVLVNHEDDIVTDFEALDESNPEAFEPDAYKYLNSVAVNDGTLYNRIKHVLGA